MDSGNTITTSELIAQFLRPVLGHLRNSVDVQSSSTATPELDLSVRDDGPEVAALRLALGAIEAYIHKEIAAHQQCRNLRAPIHRLPTEIISLIFQFIEPDYFRTTSDANTRKNAPLNVSSVSRRWRQVALSTPEIWSKIDMRSTSLAALFIERSKRAPLDVAVDQEPKMMALVLPHIDRWRALRAIIPAHRGKPQPFVYASKLEALSIIRSSYQRKGEVQEFIHLLTGTASQLRTLALEDRIFEPLEPHVFASLTSLRLAGIVFDQTAPQLLQALELSPCLEELTLDNVNILAVYAGPPPVPPRVDLARLKSFLLQSLSHFTTIWILSCVLLPAPCRLAIHSSLARHSSLSFPSEINDLSQVLPGNLTSLHNVQSVRHLLFDVDPGGKNVWSLHGQSAEGDILLAITMESDRGVSAGSGQKVFVSLTTALPIPLEALTLVSYGAAKWSNAKFTRTISSFPTIKEITFDGCDSKFIQTLASTPTKPPSLEKLTIKNGHLPEEALVSLVLARAVFKTRSTSRVPLRRLEIIRCPNMHIGAETLSALRKHLEIYWDGEEAVG
ncbi:hypothetical protein BOTBODRAFT_172479 [Botryobasidium botryosum FD-172 SS1]|uniref:F-box domain-containing protein n=1 Tax=Botryobasidium botryosum (strain FD-172 SS1) TaxID=930990 RepID=A0A067MPG8_BOTB1|nr:hypothetical protein BOTBODRAFT_172479 [Botryobasidium botryosum FD-172 SS1]